MGDSGGGGVDTPKAAAPPPPPPPPPTKADEDVQNEKAKTMERKKFARGREKTLLEQTGSQGKKKKNFLGN